jgi:colanic acid/amylovoran biosynthesis glycosyltransferase
MTVVRPSSYGYQARSLSSLYRLSALCSRPGHYDVIHAHFGPVGSNVRFVRDLWKAPLIVTFHGYDFSKWPRQHGFGVYDRLFQLVDAVTVNSMYTGKKVEQLGCSPAKIYRLPVGLDLNCFPYRERYLPKPGEQVRLLTVGRLTEKKGIEHSIRAVDEARGQYPYLRYDIIGEGPLHSELQALIQRLGLEGVVVLHGAKPGDYVRHMMDEAHIFLLTSVTATDGDQEGTPVALMEAQASGLPTLSTWHSGISEIVVDGKTGFLVPERDVEAASERLMWLLQNSDRWREMGMQGRRHAESNHDIHSLNIELAELYDKIAVQYKSRHRSAWM